MKCRMLNETKGTEEKWDAESVLLLWKQQWYNKYDHLRKDMKKTEENNKR